MADEPEPKGPNAEPEFSREVAAQAARKRKARRNPAPGVWFGLGMTGLIGWSASGWTDAIRQPIPGRWH